MGVRMVVKSPLTFASNPFFFTLPTNFDSPLFLSLHIPSLLSMLNEIVEVAVWKDANIATERLN